MARIALALFTALDAFYHVVPPQPGVHFFEIVDVVVLIWASEIVGLLHSEMLRIFRVVLDVGAMMDQNEP